MASLLYLLRHPSNSLSRALYSTQDLSTSVCTLETVTPSPPSDRSVITIQSGQGMDGVIGQPVSYKQFLDLVLQASKVIIV